MWWWVVPYITNSNFINIQHFPDFQVINYKWQMNLSISFLNHIYIYIFQITIMSFTAFLQKIAYLVIMHINSSHTKWTISFGGTFVQDKYNYPRPYMKELYGSIDIKMTRLDRLWHIKYPKWILLFSSLIFWGN